MKNLVFILILYVMVAHVIYIFLTLGSRRGRFWQRVYWQHHWAMTKKALRWPQYVVRGTVWLLRNLFPWIGDYTK